MSLKITPEAHKKLTEVNYETHLGHSKPIIGMKTIEKKVAGKPQPTDLIQSEVLHPGVFTNGMQVTVEGGRTLNLGNYESARVGVTITVPCDQNTLNDAYEFATNWISQKIEEAIKAAKGE